jgi:hypothetical protein
MSNTIPTAEEFLNTQDSYNKNKHVFPLGTGKIIQQNMIEFAKLHVKAALKAKVKAMEDYIEDGQYDTDEIDSFTQNAYPLDNIK